MPRAKEAELAKTSRKTMADLARLAGVNVSTVSRALSDSPLVKPETKAEILRIAGEIGYSVNVAARHLRRQSSEAIGIVIPLTPDSEQTISDPFFLEMVGAVSEAAADHGYDLIVSLPRADNEIAERRLLQTGRADGLIVIGQAGRSERLNALGDLKQKIVVWGGHVEEADYALVGSDNVRGGYMAAAHLLERGRRHLVFLGDVALPEVGLRYQGFQAALRERGLTSEDAATIHSGFGGRGAMAALRAYLDSGREVDGVCAASDVLAMAAIHALNAASMSVPGQVSVVGYDNIGQSALFTPPLTTIDQNIRQGGQLMVEKLLAQLAGGPVSSSHTPTELIVRGSS